MKDTSHWSQKKELTAGYWHLKLLLVLFKIFPVFVLRLIAFPVGFFYFLFSKSTRVVSRYFLEKVSGYIKEPEIAKKCRRFFSPLRHIVSFSLTLLEKLQAWGGRFSFKNINFQNDDRNDLLQKLENNEGVFLITSHLGNIELLRGLASFNRTGLSREAHVTAIVDMNVSKDFTRMLKELNPQSAFDIVNVREIGPQTAALLDDKIESGAMVTIAGDRTSANKEEKNFMFSFLGAQAPFSPGAFYLAVLLKAPVYFVFAVRRGDLSLFPKYDIYVHKSDLSFDCPRKERLSRSRELAMSYITYLERYCKEKPFQWYNFYDFWSKGE